MFVLLQGLCAFRERLALDDDARRWGRRGGDGGEESHERLRGANASDVDEDVHRTGESLREERGVLEGVESLEREARVLGASGGDETVGDVQAEDSVGTRRARHERGGVPVRAADVDGVLAGRGDGSREAAEGLGGVGEEHARTVAGEGGEGPRFEGGGGDAADERGGRNLAALVDAVEVVRGERGSGGFDRPALGERVVRRRHAGGDASGAMAGAREVVVVLGAVVVVRVFRSLWWQAQHFSGRARPTEVDLVAATTIVCR